MSQKDLYIYNSLTSSKEKFKSLRNNSVGMYVCGPTVYSEVHLGNCRTFISFDVIFRYLKHLGYNVRYVRNITDVGHLEDTGEDKISKKAKIEQLEPMEIAQKYTNSFREILKKFNVLDPSIEPTASGHITEQISIIEDLIRKNLAYISNGSVYFDISNYNDIDSYGKLSGRDLDNIKSNSRDLISQDDKKNEFDFALWKKAEKNHLMKWNSPWSEGYPGWHLECTAMSKKYLGEEFDIHGGGDDLCFPHHQNEWAQVTAMGKPFARYWVHSAMVNVAGEKMSKSLGNFTNLAEAIDTAGPRALRLLAMQTHYRRAMEMGREALTAASTAIDRLDAFERRMTAANVDLGDGEMEPSVVEGFKAAMDDDFGTPVALDHAFGVVRGANAALDEGDLATAGLRARTALTLFSVLGIEIGSPERSEQPGLDTVEIESLIEQRRMAREEKDFVSADQIRDQLADMGVTLEDTSTGVTWHRT